MLPVSSSGIIRKNVSASEAWSPAAVFCRPGHFEAPCEKVAKENHMDVYKLKWKMGFRLKKLKAFFKLCEYKFRHRFHLEGDDQFYYYLQRSLMEDLVKADPEQEYLEEHGLLPEEPEPEPEPEQEQEPGLIRELGFCILMMTVLHLDNATYMVTEVKEYEDRICLRVTKVEDMEPVEYDFCLSHRAGQRYTDFAVEGQPLRFDGEALTLLVPGEDASAE